MKREQRIALYKKALKEWGEESQVMMCIEENSELIQALCKLWRVGNGKGYQKQKMLVQYEIADVEIMIEQMKIIFGASDCERCKDEKLERLKKRLYL